MGEIQPSSIFLLLQRQINLFVIVVRPFSTVFHLQDVRVKELQQLTTVDFLFGEQFDLLGCFLAEDLFDASVEPLGEGSAIYYKHFIHSHRVHVRYSLNILLQRRYRKTKKLFLKVQDIVVCLDLARDKAFLNDPVVDVIESLEKHLEGVFVKLHISEVHYTKRMIVSAHSVTIDKPLFQQQASFLCQILNCRVVEPLPVMVQLRHALLHLEIARVVVPQQCLLLVDLNVLLSFEGVSHIFCPLPLLFRIAGVVENPSFFDPERHEEMILVVIDRKSAVVELLTRSPNPHS